MKNNFRTILMIIDINGDEIQTTNLEHFVHIIKTRDIETIVVGEVNQQNNTVVWEKQFSEVTVMPSGFRN